MPIVTYRQALNACLHDEMSKNPDVVVFGEDVVGGLGTKGLEERELDEAWGGVMGVTKGLRRKFGDRVRDTPISESAIVGAAVGAAVSGLRPVVELMYVDFIGVCLDQLMNQAAKLRYMFGGNAKVPMVVRSMYGAGFSAGAQHSQALYPMLMHIPGLKVVAPSTPQSAYGLLKSAIRDENPVIFLEHKMLYDSKGEVDYSAPDIALGKAATVRSGDDITIVAVGRMVGIATEAANQILEERGIDCEVIDVQSLAPLDEESILVSVRKTGHLVVVDEAYPRCGFASEVTSIVAIKGFASLKAPIVAVTPPEIPVPFAPSLEALYVPDVDSVVGAVEMCMHSGVRSIVSV
ncbi:MAG: alpha-ketoacid dehydrogenase subunit beta [Microbacteriaceae bacterium]|nr:MAG: alpha-ketoacid dehydrogenase subunit beta [Microbacteriaceae bacterium]